MGKHGWMVWVALGLGLGGCPDEEGTAGSGGDGGSGGAGGAGGSVADDTPPNLVCPENIGPLDGPYAMKGPCCYRTSNKKRLEAAGDGPNREIEYRLHYNTTVNHPMTLGPVEATTVARMDNYEQSLLFRFTGPRVNGEQGSGEGTATISQGRYNCDGTFSFYSDTAAPARTISSDPGRWKANVVPTTIDASKEGIERSKASFADTTNRGYAYVPFVNPMTFALEWELVSQGFDMVEVPTGPEYSDCMGSRGTSGWEPIGKYKSYTPMALNDVDVIPSINETMCQLLAFGIVAMTEGTPVPQCEDERCTPGEEGCAWLKLPDSLCPDTEGDQAMWGCHVGYENNPDGDKTNCTAEKPTTVLDPAMGATSEGQCCDPLGKSTDLPACNAYLLINSFVAAAVDITEEPSSTLQPDCH